MFFSKRTKHRATTPSIRGSTEEKIVQGEVTVAQNGFNLCSGNQAPQMAGADQEGARPMWPGAAAIQHNLSAAFISRAPMKPWEKTPNTECQIGQ